VKIRDLFLKLCKNIYIEERRKKDKNELKRRRGRYE